MVTPWAMALRKHMDTNYTHGEGVAIGMYQITLNSEEQNLTEKGTASQIKGFT